MNIYNLLQSLDEAVFKVINQTLTHPLLDEFFPIITSLNNSKFFLGLVLALFAFLIYKKRLLGVKVIATLILAAGICDFVSYKFLKASIKRPRPHFVERVQSIVRVPHKPSSYSMPSNHALTTFALATLLGYFFSTWKVFWFVFATLVAYSRVYVGVHFPLDIIFGGFVGYSISSLMLKIPVVKKLRVI